MAGEASPKSLPSATALFLEDFNQSNSAYVGKMRIFDAFFTGKEIQLNIRGNQYRCTKTGKYLIFFTISPQPFDHEVWNSFEEITLLVDCD